MESAKVKAHQFWWISQKLLQQGDLIFQACNANHSQRKNITSYNDHPHHINITRSWQLLEYRHQSLYHVSIYYQVNVDPLSNTSIRLYRYACWITYILTSNYDSPRKFLLCRKFWDIVTMIDEDRCMFDGYWLCSSRTGIECNTLWWNANLNGVTHTKTSLPIGWRQVSEYRWKVWAVGAKAKAIIAGR